MKNIQLKYPNNNFMQNIAFGQKRNFLLIPKLSFEAEKNVVIYETRWTHKFNTYTNVFLLLYWRKENKRYFKMEKL